MTSTSALGATSITLQFELSRSIDGAAVGCAGDHHPGHAPTAAGDAHPPSFRKVNPADQPIIYLAVTSPTMPLVLAERVRRHHDGATHLDGVRRGAGADLRSAEVRGACAGGSRRPWPRAKSASTKSRPRWPNGMSTSPPASCTGPAECLHRAGQRTVDATPINTSPSSWLIATARPCGWETSARPSTASKTTRPPPGICTRQRKHRSIVLAVQKPARHQHHRGHRRHQAAAAEFPRSDAAHGVPSRYCTTGPIRFTSRSTIFSSPCS